ncbi:hypothetical protein NIES37_03890 [Tolypothrix tenuis PCC 7101]|uniref:Uncharacterized protein n=1 Tax=Tolypothrix tenuis PCC 7101 TaxID=231146 RepID=A0A1Z4MSK5_9CYAN|nr:hypothetical protein NIES37_03890 [Tolypothrix tenuis PCC 7101]BAZ73036.1 hypothetical protein NIES50_15940 [Aulosira laxa NIES-50]
MKQPQSLAAAIASLHFITLAMTKYVFTHLGCSRSISILSFYFCLVVLVFWFCYQLIFLTELYLAIATIKSIILN